MKKLLLTAGLLFSPVLLAHPGHAGDVGMSHDFEHAMWMLGGLAVVAVAVFAIKTGRFNWWK